MLQYKQCLRRDGGREAAICQQHCSVLAVNAKQSGVAWPETAAAAINGKGASKTAGVYTVLSFPHLTKKPS